MDAPTCSFIATYTQTNAAGTAVIVDLKPGAGNEILLQSMTFVFSSLAGARTTVVNTMDVNNNVTGTIFPSTACNSATTHSCPSLPTAAAAAGGEVEQHYNPGIVVSGSDKIRFNALALAQNETAQLIVRAKLRGPLPTSTSVTAGVTEGSKTSKTI